VKSSEVSIDACTVPEAQVVLTLLQRAFGEWALPYTIFQSSHSVSWIENVIEKGEAQSGQRLQVARVGDRIVGFYLARQNPEISFLSYIATASEVERQGIGRHLLDDFEAAAWRRGCGEVALDVFENNTTTHLWYLRHGYQEKERKFFARFDLSHHRETPALSEPDRHAWNTALESEAQDGYARICIQLDGLDVEVGLLNRERLRLMSWHGSLEEAVLAVARHLSAGRRELVVLSMSAPPADTGTWRIDDIIELRKPCPCATNLNGKKPA
jgi:ribosomal protein S18 acetylase RimI-like enzyme